MCKKTDLARLNIAVDEIDTDKLKIAAIDLSKLNKE